MKQFVAPFLFLIMLSCSATGWAQEKKANKSSTPISKQAKQLFSKKSPAMLTLKDDAKIPYHDWVDDCISRYAGIYGKSSEPEIKKAYADYTVYKRQELADWLEYLRTTTNCDNIRVFYGVYPREGEDIPVDVIMNPVQAKRARLTVFLWPFTGDVRTQKNSKAGLKSSSQSAPSPTGDEDPYDLGEIRP